MHHQQMHAVKSITAPDSGIVPSMFVQTCDLDM